MHPTVPWWRAAFEELFLRWTFVQFAWFVPLFSSKKTKIIFRSENWCLEFGIRYSRQKRVHKKSVQTINDGPSCTLSWHWCSRKFPKCSQNITDWFRLIFFTVSILSSKMHINKCYLGGKKRRGEKIWGECNRSWQEKEIQYSGYSIPDNRQNKSDVISSLYFVRVLQIGY